MNNLYSIKLVIYTVDIPRNIFINACRGLPNFNTIKTFFKNLY